MNQRNNEMAVLHLIKNRDNVTTVSSLSRLFNSEIEEKMDSFDEVRLVFDPYREGSSKMATREKKEKKNRANISCCE